MIIWRGYGFAVLLFAILGIIIGGVLSDMLGTSASWPFALGLFVGAGANHFTAKKRDADERTLVDPETGQTVVLKHGDSLFWIPMKYWTYVIGGLGLLMLFVSGQS
jgi:hypothetical protein